MQPLAFAKSPLTIAEFKAINWQYMWKAQKSVFILPAFMMLVFLYNAISAFFITNSKIDAVGSLLPIAFIFAVGGLLYFVFSRGFKKNYHNNSALSEGLTYSLTDESISFQGSLISGTQPWSASFKKAVKIGKWLILSSSGNAAYFLDTEKLIAPATLTDLRELLKKKNITLKGQI